MIIYNDKETTKIPKNIILDIQGKDHKIVLNDFIGEGKLFIKLRGTGCFVSFGKGNIIEKGTLTIAGNNYPNKICEGSCIIKDNNKFRGNLAIYLPLNKDKTVSIGCNNLFAANTEIIGCTEHEVLDLNTKEVLNTEQNVIIGDHNWIGRDVLFMCKAGIQNNSVVGIRSLITKSFNESNILLAGVPAVIKRRNVTWREEHDRN